MPTPALSLVGFMDQTHAIQYLRTACVCPDESDPALLAEWQVAQTKLGQAFAKAGQPDIQAIPPAQEQHVQQLKGAPWCAHVFQGPWATCEFKLVEIDPLLAYQFNIGTGRSDHHCNGLSTPPSMPELMNLCLPLTPNIEHFATYNSPNSMLLKARSLNLRNFGGGVFNAAFLGIQFGVSLPFVHVVRHNGRCYLHNGFHRALGIRAAGATHMPCIFRDVPDHATVGIQPNGATFSATLLESDNPPTVGHYTQKRAYDVALRQVARVLHVSWAEYVLPEE